MPPLKVFGLGKRGINVRESPLHLEDGEWTIAQNAELSRDLAKEGLCKRLGIEEFTPDALDGTIHAIVSIPLPDPFEDALGGPGTAPPSLTGDNPPQSGVPGQTGVIEIFVDGNPPTSAATADGTTWSIKTIAALSEGFHNGGPPKCYFYDGFAYYMASGTEGQIRKYDGTTDALEAQLPATHAITGSAISSVTGLAGIGNQLFVIANYDSPYIQVYTTVIGSGSVTAFCEGFKTTAGPLAGFLLRTPVVNGIVAFNGSVFVAARDGALTTGHLYRGSPGDSNWTSDETFAARRIEILGSAGTSLWFTTRADAGAAYQLERRDVGGAVTVIRGPQASQPGAMGAFMDRVYVLEGTNLLRSTDNGATFTTIATGSIGSSQAAIGKLSKLGSTFYLLLNTEFLRDDGASVTEIPLAGGNPLSGLMRF